MVGVALDEPQFVGALGKLDEFIPRGIIGRMIDAPILPLFEPALDLVRETPPGQVRMTGKISRELREAHARCLRPVAPSLDNPRNVSLFLSLRCRAAARFRVLSTATYSVFRSDGS